MKTRNSSGGGRGTWPGMDRRALVCLPLLMAFATTACTEPSPSSPARQATGARDQAGGPKKGRLSNGNRRNPARKVTVAKRRQTAPAQDESPGSDPPDSSHFLVPDHSLPTRNQSLALPRRGPPLPVIDQQRVAAAGIRKIEGKHLVLYTDVQAGPAVEELPRVFDAAIALWCHYFGIDVDQVAQWKIVGYLMQRKERFQGTGLLPDDLPPFLNGYQRGAELWWYEQPSDYYRRHLLLHEGTHAFMQWQLGGAGPPWYMEGMAELLATHRWQNEQLQLAYFPQNREEVEQWGRIKIVKDELAAGRGMSLEQIMDYSPTAHLRIEPYGWCWAASIFLDRHPQFQKRFHQLPAHVRDEPAAFAHTLEGLYEPDRRELNEQWQLFTMNIEYGYDIPREAVLYEPRLVQATGVQQVQVRADRGWQSSGLEVQAGRRYIVAASGRYQVARVPRIWWCEPGGVTIRYHRGMPLGMLLAAVSNQAGPSTGLTGLANPQRVGLSREMTFSRTGTLFFRINDSPAELDDNSGELTVRISEVR